MASIASWDMWPSFVTLRYPLIFSLATLALVHYLEWVPFSRTPRIEHSPGVSCQPMASVVGRLRPIESAFSDSTYRTASFLSEALISHAAPYATGLCGLKQPKPMNLAWPFTTIAIG